MLARRVATGNTGHGSNRRTSSFEIISRAIRDIDAATTRIAAVERTVDAVRELLDTASVSLKMPGTRDAHNVETLAFVTPRVVARAYPIGSEGTDWAGVIIEVAHAGPVSPDDALDAVEALIIYLRGVLPTLPDEAGSAPGCAQDPTAALSDVLSPFDNPEQVRREAVAWIGELLGADEASIFDLATASSDFRGVLPEIHYWRREPVESAITAPGPDGGSHQGDRWSSSVTIDLDHRPDVSLTVTRSPDGAEWTPEERALFEALAGTLRRHLNRSIQAQRASIRASCLEALQRLTTEASASTNLIDLCRTVHLATNELFAVDAFVVTLRPPGDVAMTVYRAEGDRIYPGRPAVASLVEVMDAAQARIVGDIPPESILPADRFGDPTRRIRSAVAVPLLSEGIPIGLLSAQCYHPHAFQWEQAEILASVAQSAVGAFERHILLEQTSRQARRDATLRSVASRINQTLDTEELLSIASDAIFDTVPGAFLLVSLVDLGTYRIGARSFRSSDPAVKPPPPGVTLAQDSLTRAALRDMTQIVVPNCSRGPYSTFRVAPWPIFGSAVATPVAIDTDLAGIIVLARHEKDAFTEDDRSVQRQIAALLSTALQNATAYARTLRHASDLNELQRLGSAIASQLDLSRSLAEITESARLLAGADGCAVGMLDDGNLVTVSAVGSVVGRIPERVPVEGSLLRNVICHAEPAAINDLADISPDQGDDWIASVRSRGWLAVPLNDPDGEAVGVISVFTDEPRYWNERDRSLLATLGASSALAIQNARHFEGTRDLLRASVESLAAAVEAKDPYARNHSRNVSRYSRLIARELGLDDETVGQIELAGLLHDVGKIGIPDIVLEKNGPLDPAEWAAIHLHPVIGEQILSGNPVLEPLLPMVRHHHERWDGHGYPDRLQQAEIPVGSTIIAVAEALDAMMSDRSYHAARPWSSAVAEITQGRGSQFAPEVVDAFTRAAARGAFSDDADRSPDWTPGRSGWNPQRDPPLDVRALHILEEVANSVRSGAHLEEFLGSVVAMLKRVLDVPYIALFTMSGLDGELDLLVSIPAVPAHDNLSSRLRRGGGIVGWVARHGVLQNIPDVTADERYIDGEYPGRSKSELCVPLLAEGEVIGVLNLESHLPGAFSEMDERLLMSTADHIASAIHVVRLHDRLKKLSVTDALTGVHNHRSFFDHLVAETDRAIQDDRRLTIAILDVNDLKAINDSYGHLTGDAALRAIAQVLERHRREHDIVCRYGGDEFAMILPGTTSDESHDLLREITTELSAGNFDTEDVCLPLPALSWGTATSPDDGRRPIELLSIADERMYRQKQQRPG